MEQHRNKPTKIVNIISKLHFFLEYYNIIVYMWFCGALGRYANVHKQASNNARHKINLIRLVKHIL